MTLTVERPAVVESAIARLIDVESTTGHLAGELIAREPVGDDGLILTDDGVAVSACDINAWAGRVAWVFREWQESIEAALEITSGLASHLGRGDLAAGQREVDRLDEKLGSLLGLLHPVKIGRGARGLIKADRDSKAAYARALDDLLEPIQQMRVRLQWMRSFETTSTRREDLDDAAPPERINCFYPEGGGWRIGYHGKSEVFPHRKGFGDLHTLLSEPNPRHPWTWLQLDPPPEGVPEGYAGESPLDKEAVEQLRRRLVDIDELLDTARDHRACDRIEELEEEKLQLARQLRDAMLFERRGFAMGRWSPQSKAEDRVQKRIRSAINVIEAAPMAALAEHLRGSIVTTGGRRFGYYPTGESSPSWQTRRPI